MQYHDFNFTELWMFFWCRYSLQGDTKKYFSIGKYSGELKTVQALDREENSTYTMEVIAVDGRKIISIITVNAPHKNLIKGRLYGSVSQTQI